MKAFVSTLLLLSAALAVSAVPAAVVPANAAAATKDAATLTLQFDNTKKAVLTAKQEQKILKALASIFLVPVTQVKVVGGLDTNSQSVVIFQATGPTSNKKTVLVNCEENTKGGLRGKTDSAAKKAVKKATDKWWPGENVKISKASCAQA